VKKGITNAFFYGDLCQDPRMSYSAMLALSEVLGDPEFSEIEFFIILGNHDMKGRTPSVGHSLEVVRKFEVAKRSNIHMFLRGRDVLIDGAKVRFLPFPCSEFSPKALNVCHLDVYGAVSDSGRQILNKERDRSNNVVVAGHIHTKQRIRNTFYSGTLYQTCFGEKLPKFFHEIEFNNVNDYEIRDVPFDPKIKLHVVTAQGPDDLPKELTKNDLVKLVIRDGANITAADYQHLNVVQVRTFQSKQDLVSVLTEDLPSNGEDYKFQTDEFFEVWLAGQDVDESKKKGTLRLRKRLLSSLR
jgi:DNA repair exonuclease SbcCD nuclease subunit